jgi:colanic acid/amylovoran biosynthesis glycosyltransferase
MQQLFHSTMKVGLVLSSVPPYSETFFDSKINGLTKAGFEILLFASGKKNHNLLCKLVNPYAVPASGFFRIAMVLIVLPYTFLRSPRNVLRLWRYERDSGVSIISAIRRLYLNAHILVHNVDWIHFGFASLAIDRENVARAIGAKMGVSLRGYDINVYPIKNPGCYNLLWSRVDQVHSISKYLLQKAFDLGLSKNKPTRIITPAIAIQVDPKDSYELHDPITILTVGRLVEIKGLQYGIRAMANLKSAGLKIQYTIVGDGLELENLLRETDSLGLNEEVIFLGKLSHEKTIERMRDCDVYIQPSLNEGFCNSVLEAQAVGCLCIVSDVGALPENIVRHETGWLVPSMDASLLASSIIEVIRLPLSKKIEVVNRAKQRIQESFTGEAHISAWKEFYKNKR